MPLLTTQGLRYSIHHIIVHLPGQGVVHLAAFVLLFKISYCDAKCLLVFKITKKTINVSRFRNPTDLTFTLIYLADAFIQSDFQEKLLPRHAVTYCSPIFMCYFTIGNYRWSQILLITQLVTCSGGFRFHSHLSFGAFDLA